MRIISISITIAVLLITLLFGCTEESIQNTNDGQIPPFAGRLTGHTDCKGFLKAALSTDGSDSSSCVGYSFDAVVHKFILKHVNAGFNCCPESLFCLINLRNDTIIVEEREKIPGCHCDCLYDLDMEINGIVAKKYHVRFIEPYCGDQDKLYFDVDLATAPEGSYCVKRTGYPWGG